MEYLKVSSGRIKAEFNKYNKNFGATPIRNVNFSGDEKSEEKDNTILKAGLGASLLSAVVLGALAVNRGKNLKDAVKTVSEQASKIDDLNKNVEDLNKQITNVEVQKQKEIDKVRAELKNVLDDSSIEVDEAVSQYRNDINASYSQKACSQFVSDDTGESCIRTKEKYNISDLPVLTGKNEQAVAQLDASTIFDEYQRKGNYHLTINSDKNISLNHNNSQQYEITDEDTGVERSDILVSYGSNVRWSNEKIARDIFQNFYDGHNHTLDGVELSLNKQENGKTQIKISGQGIYNYENLRDIGASTKNDDNKNAGGFGEGAKVLLANMFANESTDAVTYSSSNWKYTFYPKDRAIYRKLEKLDTPLNGNYIEFETQDDELVKKIIESLNYFEHSSNKDFLDLTYDSDAFGFKILDMNKSEKGNFYLTQRFEVGEPGNWNNSMNGLTLIFKEKPNLDEYKQITGTDFHKDRDRSVMTDSDIENLTFYFASKMEDKDLLAAFMSTKCNWAKIAMNPYANQNIMFRAFCKGLLKAMHKKEIYVNFDIKDMYVYQDYRTDEVVRKHLNSLGYTILPNEFEHSGMLSTSDLFRKLSEHKQIMPDDNEKKKIAILDKAVSEIQQYMETARNKMLSGQIEVLYKNIPWSFNTKFSSVEEFNKSVNSIIKELQKEEKYDELSNLLNDIYNNDSTLLEDSSVKTIKKCYYLNLITKDDVEKPKYIFDNTTDITDTTLGEAVIKDRKYQGHWIDKKYLKEADFSTILATWIHEICHKTGGDGTSEFTYGLTNILRSLFDVNLQHGEGLTKKLKALSVLYDEISQQATQK